jgi:hypothetical protein
VELEISAYSGNLRLCSVLAGFGGHKFGWCELIQENSVSLRRSSLRFWSFRASGNGSGGAKWRAQFGHWPSECPWSGTTGRCSSNRNYWELVWGFSLLEMNFMYPASLGAYLVNIPIIWPSRVWVWIEVSFSIFGN